MFNLQDNSQNFQIFYATGSTSWQTWNKPSSCKFVHIFCLGGGGGGGAGQAAGTGTARRGGASGGSSAFSVGMFLSNFLPDTLYIQVGAGGAGGVGGASSTNGTTGDVSYVSIAPVTGTFNVILQSGTSGGGGGQSGLNGGTAGTAGGVWTGGSFDFAGLATGTAGVVGVAGQTTAVPTNTTVSQIVTGGGVGAGTNGATPQNGGNITGSGFLSTVSGGTTASIHGSGGYTSLFSNNTALNRAPMIFTGGGGGASSNASNGGDGGNASFGCGGGGGGAGFTNLAGNGGKGGDGIVIITCW